MTKEEKILQNLSTEPAPIIDKSLTTSGLTVLDLSTENTHLKQYDITDPVQCQAYIDKILDENQVQLAFGGYLETRNLYDKSPNFSDNTLEKRNIHLGMDIWAPAGTPILAPAEGVIHSFADNHDYGNYGPTIILEHSTEELKFYTLYGHLSKGSIKDLKRDILFAKGERLAELGQPRENGYYAPHLHFQIILDLEGLEGDYPGVCSKSTLDHFKKNCPDPNLLLKISI